MTDLATKAKAAVPSAHRSRWPGSAWTSVANGTHVPKLRSRAPTASPRDRADDARPAHRPRAGKRLCLTRPRACRACTPSFRHENGRYVIDPNSQNGTWLDGTRVQWADVASGSEIATVRTGSPVGRQSRIETTGEVIAGP